MNSGHVDLSSLLCKRPSGRVLSARVLLVLIVGIIFTFGCRTRNPRAEIPAGPEPLFRFPCGKVGQDSYPLSTHPASSQRSPQTDDCGSQLLLRHE